MFCPDLLVKEFDFLQVFELSHNYLVNGNTLMLNADNDEPLAIFTKTNNSTAEITEKYWKLKTLNGKAVSMADNQEKEAYFMLKAGGNVKGFSGCNSFNGSYTIEEGNRIRFKQMFSTERACPDLGIDESGFLKVFESVDNYTINEDVLKLNAGKRAPLAVFEAVYF